MHNFLKRGTNLYCVIPLLVIMYSPNIVLSTPQGGGFIDFRKEYESSIFLVKKVLKDPLRKEEIKPGTAFLIDGRGYLLTANHVVSLTDTEKSQNKIISRIEVIWPKLKTSPSFIASIIGVDEANDLALIKIDLESSIEFTYTFDISFEKPSIGKKFAIYGFNDGEIPASFRRADINNIKDGLFITHAAVYAGDSGGPAIDKSGKVIGVCREGFLFYKGKRTHKSMYTPLTTSDNLLLKLPIDAVTEKIKRDISKNYELKELEKELVSDQISNLRNIQIAKLIEIFIEKKSHIKENWEWISLQLFNIAKERYMYTHANRLGLFIDGDKRFVMDYAIVSYNAAKMVEFLNDDELNLHNYWEVSNNYDKSIAASQSEIRTLENWLGDYSKSPLYSILAKKVAFLFQDVGNLQVDIAKLTKEDSLKREVLEKGADYFDKAVAWHPMLPNAHRTRASVAYQLGDYYKAEESILKAYSTGLQNAAAQSDWEGIIKTIIKNTEDHDKKKKMEERLEGGIEIAVHSSVSWY